MDVSITSSFDEITLNKSSLVEKFSNSLIGILQDKNYGEVVKTYSLNSIVFRWENHLNQD